MKKIIKRYIFWLKVRRKFCELVGNTPSELKAPHRHWTDHDRCYRIDFINGHAEISNGSYAHAVMNLDNGHVITDDTPDFDGCCLCHYSNLIWNPVQKQFDFTGVYYNSYSGEWVK